MGAGLLGVWCADLRSRQVRDLVLFAEHIRQIAVLYDGLVVPGALLLLGSGTWLIGMRPSTATGRMLAGWRSWRPPSPRRDRRSRHGWRGRPCPWVSSPARCAIW
jgi:hypothetical protein